MTRPIAFFVHHQGRGHANRTMALVEALIWLTYGVATADLGRPRRAVRAGRLRHHTSNRYPRSKPER